MIRKAGFGGGCHWCTEAVFSALKDVEHVQQGWIASDGENDAFSEAVIVLFDDSLISLETLIAVHLYTHSSTSQHSMRGKYRSAVYTFSNDDVAEIKKALEKLQCEFDKPIVTIVLPFTDFKLNREDSLNYYFSDPERPFCETYINPKLKLILEKFSAVADTDKLKHL